MLMPGNGACQVAPYRQFLESRSSTLRLRVGEVGVYCCAAGLANCDGDERWLLESN